MADSITNQFASCTKTTGFEVDLVFFQDFQEWISMYSDDEWDKDLSSYLDSYNIFSEEYKFDFLKKLLKAFELEYERLLSEKTSQDVSIGVMHENIVPHKQEFIKVESYPLESNESMLQIYVLYKDMCMTLNKELNQHILESKKWVSDDCEKFSSMEIVKLELIQRQFTYLEQEIEIFNHNTVFNYFYDLVAAYLEVFINSIHSVLFSCKYGFQIHDKNRSIFQGFNC